MPNQPLQGKKEVKAWAIYSKEKNDIADVIFISKKIAQDRLRADAYHADPFVMKEILKKYKVIPCTITYEI